MKPTELSHTQGDINQIAARATFSGDIRLTPFYDPEQVKEKIMDWVEDINANIDKLPSTPTFLSA